MQIIQGKPISPGYVQGRAVLLGVGELSAPRRIVAADEVEGEIERFYTAFVGQVMKASKGKANPQQVNDLLKSKLNG